MNNPDTTDKKKQYDVEYGSPVELRNLREKRKTLIMQLKDVQNNVNKKKHRAKFCSEKIKNYLLANPKTKIKDIAFNKDLTEFYVRRTAEDLEVKDEDKVQWKPRKQNEPKFTLRYVGPDKYKTKFDELLNSNDNTKPITKNHYRNRHSDDEDMNVTDD